MSETRDTSVWLRPEKRGRAKPALDLNRIITAAIAQLDEGGPDSLTMRKLATRLDVAPMTLYGHVANKSDLLELALDDVFAEAMPQQAPSDDWRAELTEIAERTFDALLRHPWAAPLIGGRPPLGPGATTHFARLIRVLTDAGFRDAQLDSAITGTYYYVLGAALAESAWNQVDQREAQRYAASIQHTVTTKLPLGQPLSDYLRRHIRGDTHSRFREGLAGILDGLNPPTPRSHP